MASLTEPQRRTALITAELKRVRPGSCMTALRQKKEQVTPSSGKVSPPQVDNISRGVRLATKHRSTESHQETPLGISEGLMILSISASKVTLLSSYRTNLPTEYQLRMRPRNVFTRHWMKLFTRSLSSSCLGCAKGMRLLKLWIVDVVNGFSMDNRRVCVNE